MISWIGEAQCHIAYQGAIEDMECISVQELNGEIYGKSNPYIQSAWY